MGIILEIKTTTTEGVVEVDIVPPEEGSDADDADLMVTVVPLV